jgi:hypothetical protein
VKRIANGNKRVTTKVSQHNKVSSEDGNWTLKSSVPEELMNTSVEILSEKLHPKSSEY